MSEAHFSSGPVTEGQTFFTYVSGANPNTCYGEAEPTFEWRGDTLFGDITTGYWNLGGCLQVYTEWTHQDSGSVKPYGTYYLQVTEHFTSEMDPNQPIQWQYQFFDAIDVTADCGACRPGDVNHSGDISITDITCLVGHMFKGGAPPPCAAEADANGDGSQDVADLTILTGYMFKHGSMPVCP